MIISQKVLYNNNGVSPNCYSTDDVLTPKYNENDSVESILVWYILFFYLMLFDLSLDTNNVDTNNTNDSMTVDSVTYNDCKLFRIKRNSNETLLLQKNVGVIFFSKPSTFNSMC